MKGTIGVQMAQHTANRVKNLVLAKTAKSIGDGYARLQDYLDTLAEESGGTVVDVEWDGEGHMVRCFMMLGGSAYFAMQGVQEAFAMDGAHLKGVWNGVMITLSFKDANNKIVHVATAINAKEDKESYMYLLTNAMKLEPLRQVLNNASYTCFTDKHKGSDSAVPALCPLTEDRRCLHHILKNIPAVGSVGMMIVFDAAKAPTRGAFDHYMDKLKAIKPISWAKLMAIPHETWANYACRENTTWNQTTSNISESTNNMIGKETRGKPVIDLHQDIVHQTASRLHAAAELKKGDDTQKLVPFAQASYNAEFTWSQELQVSMCVGGTFMVYPQGSNTHSNRVTLRFGDSPNSHEFICTCGWCSRFNMPCRHVLAAAKAEGTLKKTLELVDAGYLLHSYRLAVSDPRYRITPPVWDSLVVDASHRSPLPVGGQAGRPKKGPRPTKRKASNGEFHTSSRYNVVRSLAPAPASALASALALPPAGVSQGEPTQGQSQGMSQSQDGPSCPIGIGL